MSEVVDLFDAGWLKIKQAKDSGFTWSERKGVDSIGIIAVRYCPELQGNPARFEVQLHAEHNPAHAEHRDINWGVCGGCNDKDKPLIEIAQEELREEGGYDCPLDRITAVGKMFCTTQSSEHVHLFVADVSGLPNLGMDLEDDEQNYRHGNKWVPLGNYIFNEIEDPRAIVALTRYLALKGIY